jgi:hypothetical protein
MVAPCLAELTAVKHWRKTGAASFLNKKSVEEMISAVMAHYWWCSG